MIMLLTLLMLLMFSYTVTLLLPLCLNEAQVQAVMGVLDAMTRYGVSFSRSVELTEQWDRILTAGPLYPVTLDDLGAVRGLRIGDFCRVVSNVSSQ